MKLNISRHGYRFLPGTRVLQDRLWRCTYPKLPGRADIFSCLWASHRNRTEELTNLLHFRLTERAQR